MIFVDFRVFVGRFAELALALVILRQQPVGCGIVFQVRFRLRESLFGFFLLHRVYVEACQRGPEIGAPGVLSDGRLKLLLGLGKALLV